MEEPDLTVTPRSRREQLIEVVDNYKEKLRQIKGQVSPISVGSRELRTNLWGKKGGLDSINIWRCKLKGQIVKIIVHYR